MRQDNDGHISTILEEDEEIDTTNTTDTAQAQANRTCQDYHPDDLKGKGEPSYTLERAFKHGKSASVGDGPGVYEMQPRGMSKSSPSKDKEGDVLIRQRSRSSSFGEGPSGSGAHATSSDSPVRRRQQQLAWQTSQYRPEEAHRKHSPQSWSWLIVLCFKPT
ncbi:hypothetical protein PG997_009538 [Apiospora hydei]|uniref:Uncharacterized protein n=1 Tax=Apiospora hydei TaxID=1337664 RepID=A0ABR1VUE6_9PEZI